MGRLGIKGNGVKGTNVKEDSAGVVNQWGFEILF